MLQRSVAFNAPNRGRPACARGTIVHSWRCLVRSLLLRQVRYGFMLSMLPLAAARCSGKESAREPRGETAGMNGGAAGMNGGAAGMTTGSGGASEVGGSPGAAGQSPTCLHQAGVSCSGDLSNIG